MRGKNPFRDVSAADIDAFGRDELLDVAQLDEVEIAANRVLEGGRGGRELERVLIGEPGDAAMENAGREGVAGADAVDDAVERVGAGPELVPAREHNAAEPLVLCAVDLANRGANRLEAWKRGERGTASVVGGASPLSSMPSDNAMSRSSTNASCAVASIARSRRFASPPDAAQSCSR
jgi:hypothetical protein